MHNTHIIRKGKITVQRESHLPKKSVLLHPQRNYTSPTLIIGCNGTHVISETHSQLRFSNRFRSSHI